MQKQADAILPLKEISKSPAVLELKAVTKVFPGVKALSEVSLKLIPGEVTALVGENTALLGKCSSLEEEISVLRKRKKV